MAEWNTKFHNVSVKYEKHIIRIETNPELMKFLGEAGNGSLKLAEHIKKTYKSMFGEELKISQESLSVEILIHAYLDTFCKMSLEMGDGIEKEILKKILKFADKIEQHTKIIDCGEKEVDSNRVIFDSLVPCRGLIYGILGKAA